jgi:Protein of unknown function (DUF2877)
MGAIVTMNVIAASAGLLPLLQAVWWEGRIAAVFHTSLLFTAPDGSLLHVHPGPQLVSPFSLRIDAGFARALHQIPFAQGMPVHKSGSALVMAERLQLRLDDITYYQSPRQIAGEVDPEAIRIAQQTLNLYGHTSGVDRLPAARTLITAMQQGLATSKVGQLREATRRLVGLGLGLTPSGDDFLVGCLSGLRLIRQNKQAVFQLLERWRDALLPDVDARTTRVGAAFIRYALDGAFAEVLDLAALSFLAPARPSLVQAAVGRLLAQGETSGSDTTLGLLTGLEALLFTPDREPRYEWEAASSISSTSAATRA